MKRRSYTVSFRIDADMARLVDEARAPFGVSRGDWIRGVLTAHLHHVEQGDVNEELIEIRESIAELAVDTQRTMHGLGRMLFTVLTVGSGISPDKAKDAVRKVFPE